MNNISEWFNKFYPIIGSIAALATIFIVLQNFSDNQITNKFDAKEVAQLATKLATENRIEDTETIKQLEETIKALSEQDTDKYNIEEALTLLSQGKTEKAEKIFELVALEAKQKGHESKLKEAAARRHIGSLAYLHDTQKALKAYKKSTELDPDNKEGWNQLGHLYHRIGEIEKAESAYMTILKKTAENDQEYQAIAYGNLGLVYHIQGKLDEAIEFLEKSLAIDMELGKKEGMAAQYGNLGLVYRIQGKLDKAIEFHEKSLAINMELGKKEGMANQYDNLGLVYQTRGELDKAVKHWQKSLTLFTEIGAAPRMVLVQSWLDAATIDKVPH